MRCTKVITTARRLMVIVGLAAVAAACGAPDQDAGGHRDGAGSDLESYPRVVARWSSTTIPVCWEGAADDFPTEKAWVQEKVETQYESKTRVRFVGWSRCLTTSSGVRITVSDRPGANPHTKGLGRALNGVKNGMELNFTFNNWSRSCRSGRRKCIESIGVHEFGHAIGLAHEQNRPDTPSTCRVAGQGGDGDRLVGSWDVTSVMNYCNPVYNNNGNLSAGDIRGIAALYP